MMGVCVCLSICLLFRYIFSSEKMHCSHQELPKGMAIYHKPLFFPCSRIFEPLFFYTHLRFLVLLFSVHLSECWFPHLAFPPLSKLPQFTHLAIEHSTPISLTFIPHLSYSHCYNHSTLGGHRLLSGSSCPPLTYSLLLYLVSCLFQWKNHTVV